MFCFPIPSINNAALVPIHSLLVSDPPALLLPIKSHLHLYLNSALIHISDMNLQGTVGVREQSFWWQKIHLQRLPLELMTNFTSLDVYVIQLYNLYCKCTFFFINNGFIVCLSMIIITTQHHVFLNCFPWNLTRGFNAVYECLHLVVTFGLVCIEVGTSTNNTSAPVPELTMGLVLLLTVISIWSETNIYDIFLTEFCIFKYY